MAISINLKALSINDSQEQFIEKLTYNMNNLIELGLGKDGPDGIGLRGYPGPIGDTGVTGTRGSLWYNGTVLPTSDLIAGDQFLHESEYAIYSREDASPDIWTKTIDFYEIMNSLISSDASNTFVRLNPTNDPNNTIIVFKDAIESPYPSAAHRDRLLMLDFDFVSLDNSDNITIIRSAIQSIYSFDNWSLLIGDGDLLVGTELPALADSLKIKTDVKSLYVHSYFNLSYDQLDTEITKHSGFRFHTSNSTIDEDARFYMSAGAFQSDVAASLPATGYAAFALHSTYNDYFFNIAVEASSTDFYTDNNNPIKFNQDIHPATNLTYDIGTTSLLFNVLYVNSLRESIYIGSGGELGVNMTVSTSESILAKLQVNGSIWLDGTTDRSIIMGDSASTGNDLTIKSGDAAYGLISGGDLYLYSGDNGGGTSGSVNGSNIYIRPGEHLGIGDVGKIIMAEAGGSPNGAVCIGMSDIYARDYILNVNGLSYFGNNILLNGDSNRSITVDQTGDIETGASLTIQAGTGGVGDYVGGDLYLYAGSNDGSSSRGINGPNVYIKGGEPALTYRWGDVIMVADGTTAEGRVLIGTDTTSSTDTILTVNGDTYIDTKLGINIVAQQHLHVKHILRLEPYSGTLVAFESAYSSSLDTGDMFTIIDVTICKVQLYMYVSEVASPGSQLLHEWDIDGCTPVG